VYESSFNAGINGTPYINKDNIGKSFKISGSKMETTNYFTIEYDKNSFEKDYEVIESTQNTAGPSNWEIIDFPYDDNRLVLRNNSEIEDKQSKPDFASILKKVGYES